MILWPINVVDSWWKIIRMLFFIVAFPRKFVATYHMVRNVFNYQLRTLKIFSTSSLLNIVRKISPYFPLHSDLFGMLEISRSIKVLIFLKFLLPH